MKKVDRILSRLEYSAFAKLFNAFKANEQGITLTKDDLIVGGQGDYTFLVMFILSLILMGFSFIFPSIGNIIRYVAIFGMLGSLVFAFYSDTMRIRAFNKWCKEEKSNGAWLKRHLIDSLAVRFSTDRNHYLIANKIKDLTFLLKVLPVEMRLDSCMNEIFHYLYLGLVMRKSLYKDEKEHLLKLVEALNNMPDIERYKRLTNYRFFYTELNRIFTLVVVLNSAESIELQDEVKKNQSLLFKDLR